MFIDYLNIFAIMVFAITGAIAAIQVKKEIDILGVVILGIVTAIGGGTIRDVILDFRVFWIEDPKLLASAVLASVITFFLRRFFRIQYLLLLYLDALGNSLIIVSVMNKVVNGGFSLGIAVVMGVLTGIGGGLIRDVLTARQNLLLSRELYATPLLIGAILYASLFQLFPESVIVKLGVVAFIFLFRAAAIRYNLMMPAIFIANRNK